MSFLDKRSSITAEVKLLGITCDFIMHITHFSLLLTFLVKPHQSKVSGEAT